MLQVAARWSGGGPLAEPYLLAVSPQSVELRSAPTEVLDWEEAQRLRGLCPIQTLALYVACTHSIWTTEQLFVLFHPRILGRPLFKSQLSRWVVKAIRQAYFSAGISLPSGVRTHSTRGLATSWAFWRDASLSAVCVVATWSSATTFTWFFHLNVAASPSLGSGCWVPIGGSCHSLVCLVFASCRTGSGQSCGLMPLPPDLDLHLARPWTGWHASMYICK